MAKHVGATRGPIGKLYAGYHSIEGRLKQLLSKGKITKSRYNRLERMAWNMYEKQEHALSDVLKIEV